MHDVSKGALYQVVFLKLVLGPLCLGTSIFELVMGIMFWL
jgi:hypothetical protein